MNLYAPLLFFYCFEFMLKLVHFLLKFEGNNTRLCSSKTVLIYKFNKYSPFILLLESTSLSDSCIIVYLINLFLVVAYKLTYLLCVRQ